VQLLNYIKHKAPMLLEPGCVNQGPQGTHRATLFTDHFSHVRLRDANFEARRAVPFDFPHFNSVRIIDESFDYYFDCLAHRIQLLCGRGVPGPKL